VTVTVLRHVHALQLERVIAEQDRRLCAHRARCRRHLIAIAALSLLCLALAVALGALVVTGA
jgi:hypothetical protein